MDSNLHMAYDLARHKQTDYEKAATAARLANIAAQPSRWSRVRALFGRRSAGLPRITAPAGVPAPSLAETPC